MVFFYCFESERSGNGGEMVGKIYSRGGEDLYDYKM